MPPAAPPKKSKSTPTSSEMTSNSLKRKHAETPALDASQGGLAAKKNLKGRTAAAESQKPPLAKKRATTEKMATLDDIAAEAGSAPITRKGKAKKTSAILPSTISDVRSKKTGVQKPLKKSAKTVENVASSRSSSPASDESNEKSQEEDEEDGGSNDNSADEESESGSEDHLHGFSSDEDSSDDEVDEAMDGVDVTKLPTVAKDDATVARKLAKARQEQTEGRGVIYIGRLPHGFYENQLRGYFSQFGDITRLRMSRNKKTGASKRYAFLEFESAPVARIVAETMDNYLLMGHILRCRVIPGDEIHPQLWVGANRKFRVVPRARVARVAHNKTRSDEDKSKAEARLIRRQAEKKRRLEEAGISYNFDAVAYKKR